MRQEITLDEALLVADGLAAPGLVAGGGKQRALEKLANEVRRQHAEIERLMADAAESNVLSDTLSRLLSQTAIALRGPEPPRTRWGFHDVPERAAAAIAVIDMMQRAASALAVQSECLQAKLDEVGGGA